MKQLLSVVVPVHNEEGNIRGLYERVRTVLGHREYELIFVNDGSTDGSGAVIEEIAEHDPHVHYLEFSKNFSKEIATSAGIHHAKGDAIILIDADLQHPPELIPEFVKRWENGADMVIGVRQRDAHEGLVKRIGSHLFYRLMKAIGDIEFVPHSTDFRLIDRAVADEFNKCMEKNRITRGILDWLGFRKEYVEFMPERRRAGKASYSNRKLFALAFAAIVSHSTLPLRLVGYLGSLITVFAALLGLFIIVEDLILADPLGLNITGSAMVAVMILFLIGIMLLWLGLIAFYIFNIQADVMGRPMYVIRKTKNLK